MTFFQENTDIGTKQYMNLRNNKITKDNITEKMTEERNSNIHVQNIMRSKLPKTYKVAVAMACLFDPESFAESGERSTNGNRTDLSKKRGSIPAIVMNKLSSGTTGRRGSKSPLATATSVYPQAESPTNKVRATRADSLPVNLGVRRNTLSKIEQLTGSPKIAKQYKTKQDQQLKLKEESDNKTMNNSFESNTSDNNSDENDVINIETGTNGVCDLQEVAQAVRVRISLQNNEPISDTQSKSKNVKNITETTPSVLNYDVTNTEENTEGDNLSRIRTDSKINTSKKEENDRTPNNKNTSELPEHETDQNRSISNKMDDSLENIKGEDTSSLKSPSGEDTKAVELCLTDRKEYANVNSIDRKNPTAFKYSTKIKLPSFKIVEENTGRQLRVTNSSPLNKQMVKRRYVRTYSSGVTIPLQAPKSPVKSNIYTSNPDEKPEDLTEALAELDNIISEPPANTNRFRPAAAKRQPQVPRRKKSATICIEQRLT